MWSPWKYIAFSIASLAIGLNPPIQQSQIPPKPDPNLSPSRKRRSARRMAAINQESSREILIAEQRSINDKSRSSRLTETTTRIHLPDTPAISFLRRSLNPDQRPLTTDELARLEEDQVIANLAQNIKERFEVADSNSLSIRLLEEEEPLLNEALVEVFNNAKSEELKLKVLQFAAQNNILFLPQFYFAIRAKGEGAINLFLSQKISRSDLIANLQTIPELSNSNTELMASPLAQRADLKDLLADLLQEGSIRHNSVVTAIVAETVSRTKKLSDILSRKQCTALYRIMSSAERDKIDRLLTQVRNSFPPAEVALFLEGILRGRESDATRCAVHHYGEFGRNHSLAALSSTLLKLETPDNIISTCSALARYCGDQGREAIVGAVIQQSEDSVPIILETLCRSKQYNDAENTKIYTIDTFKKLMHSLFSRHQRLILDLKELEELTTPPKFIQYSPETNIYQSLFKQIGANTLLDWFIEETHTTNGNLRENILATNVLRFFEKIDFGSEDTRIGVNPDKLAQFKAIIAA